MATGTLGAPPRPERARAERRTGPLTLGHDLPCPWCSHSHHFLPCEDCSCPPHEHYPGEV
jgi:hypothetical protein